MGTAFGSGSGASARLEGLGTALGLFDSTSVGETSGEPSRAANAAPTSSGPNRRVSPLPPPIAGRTSRLDAGSVVSPPELEDMVLDGAQQTLDKIAADDILGKVRLR